MPAPPRRIAETKRGRCAADGYARGFQKHTSFQFPRASVHFLPAPRRFASACQAPSKRGRRRLVGSRLLIETEILSLKTVGLRFHKAKQTANSEMARREIVFLLTQEAFLVYSILYEIAKGFLGPANSKTPRHSHMGISPEIPVGASAFVRFRVLAGLHENICKRGCVPMCGIVGYIGGRQAVPCLMEGLSRLEYRGYDSTGIAVLQDGEIRVEKAKGRLVNLRDRLQGKDLHGAAGIGHTRWATHGEPSDINSHPHTDLKGGIAVVHNGIIENHAQLQAWLKARGYSFVSQTDTEVIAHLLNHYYKGDMLEAIAGTIARLEGSYALGIVSRESPDALFCVRKDSPLVIGIGRGENYIASDVPAILNHTRDIYYPDDKDIAVITRDFVSFFNAFCEPVQHASHHIDWDIAAAEKGGYEHFMLKEIHEEPRALRDTLMPLIDQQSRMIRQDMMPMDAEAAQAMRRLFIIACGTAYHAGIVGKYVIENLCRLSVEVDIASEFRYRNSTAGAGDTFLIVSQSGETADTLAALREAKRLGAKTVAITNVVGSSLAREADHVLYTWAGPEIAVASTKAYTSQLMMLYLLCVDIAHKRGLLDEGQVASLIDEMAALPGKARVILGQKNRIQRFASQYFDKPNVFFIGRGLDYALAQEASLKLKEVSYIFSEAYASGELKHGTIALVEDGTLAVALCTQSRLLDKALSNIREIKARGATVLAVTQVGMAEMLADSTDYIWEIPPGNDLLAPILAIIPMQLFAYYMAVQKGCDVDKPRNLAKSVTVE